MATAPAPRADLPGLTGIRGVAAWFVVLYHIRLGVAWALPPPVVAVLGKGYLAVDLFFMLSGFVLWLNYDDRLRAGGIGEAATFLARRIARIWPLHVFMLAGAVAFVLATAAAGRPPSDHYPWGELPLHLALMQNWGLTNALTWNDPAWSISCEFAAYLLFPLLALAADWRRFGTTVLCALLLLLAATLCAVMWARGETSLGADIPRFGLQLRAFQLIKSIRHPFLLSIDRVEVVAGELVIVTELADQNLHELWNASLPTRIVFIRALWLTRLLRLSEKAAASSQRRTWQTMKSKTVNRFVERIGDTRSLAHRHRHPGASLLLRL